MDGPTLGPLPPFSTIGYAEKQNIIKSLKRPLSGYLGGIPHGGYWVERLSSEWSNEFGCRYSIPCNSATSGLLAACMSARIGPGDEVWTTPYSMSATAACAVVLGANVRFIDIEPLRYSINPNMLAGKKPPKALIVTNLFGHPAYLSVLRAWCDEHRVVMIEDNAQSIFAMENGKYAGTIGHMGVFSLNVHKHLQCGEGGVVCTNIEGYGWMLKSAINHGELSEGYRFPGLNLRMTEPVAAIACAQLEKGQQIVEGRRRIAKAITEMTSGIPWLLPPIEDIDCKHSYYVWAGKILDPIIRRKFVHELKLRGFPIQAGYVKPLNYVFNSEDKCPETDRTNNQIITYEVCGYDPKAHHLRRMREIVEYVAENMERVETWKSQAAE